MRSHPRPLNGLSIAPAVTDPMAHGRYGGRFRNSWKIRFPRHSSAAISNRANLWRFSRTATNWDFARAMSWKKIFHSPYRSTNVNGSYSFCLFHVLLVPALLVAQANTSKKSKSRVTKYVDEGTYLLPHHAKVGDPYDRGCGHRRFRASLGDGISG